MINFTQWLNEMENKEVMPSNKPQTPIQKTVSQQISKAVTNDPKAVTTLRQGTPADKNKIVGDIASQVVKTQQKTTPNIAGQKGNEIGDIVNSIDTQIQNIDKQQSKPRMMKKK